MIEKHIPLTVRVYRGRPPLYPWHDLKAGDSFTVPYEERFKVRVSASRWGKRYGQVYVTRKEGDHIRIWRIT